MKLLKLILQRQKNQKDKNFKKQQISAFSSLSGSGKKNEVLLFFKARGNVKISTVAHQQFNNIFEAEQADANYYQRILTSSRLDKSKNIYKRNRPLLQINIKSYRGMRIR